MKCILVVVVLIFVVNIVQVEIYECDFFCGGVGGWIVFNIFIQVDESKGIVVVQDGIIQFVKKGWYDVKLVNRSDKKLMVIWWVENLKDCLGQNVKFDYCFVFIKNKMCVNVYMVLCGYDNFFCFLGLCKIVK